MKILHCFGRMHLRHIDAIKKQYETLFIQKRTVLANRPTIHSLFYSKHSHENEMISLHFVIEVLKFPICIIQPPLDDHLADTVDDEWRQEQLPHESCTVPSEKLPDPEADNGDSHLTLLEQVVLM